MADPASWLMIEDGWEVHDRSGAPLGKVTAVVGDPEVDIFDGLRLQTGAGEERFVRADLVAEITEGCVTLAAGSLELERAAEDGEPGGAEITRDRGAEL